MTFDTLSRLEVEVIMQLFAESINTRLPWHPTEKNDQITKKEEDDDDSKRVPHAAKIPIENFRHSSLELEPLIQNYVPATPLQKLFQNPKWVMIVRTF